MKRLKKCFKFPFEFFSGTKYYKLDRGASPSGVTVSNNVTFKNKEMTKSGQCGSRAPVELSSVAKQREAGGIEELRGGRGQLLLLMYT
jgi:hypothetical protein